VLNFRRLAAALASVIVAAAMVVPTGDASAYSVHWGPLKSTCSGRVLDRHVLRDEGRRIGRVELWYSPAHGGQNCVITYNFLPGRVYTQASLVVDDTGNGIGEGQGPDRRSWDHGNYRSYAGASYRNRTDGKCVSYGGVVSGRGYYRAWASGLHWCR
jgi:hypothetical protein